MSDETEARASIDLMDSFLRILGITGFLYGVFGGFALGGGQIKWIFFSGTWVYSLIVCGTVFFGLLCTYQVAFLAYIPKALKACVVKPKPNADHCEISECGRRYAAAGGGLSVMLGIINTMSTLEDPEMVGKKIAISFTGVIIAILLSQVFFVYLRHSFAPKRTSN